MWIHKHTLATTVLFQDRYQFPWAHYCCHKEFYKFRRYCPAPLCYRHKGMQAYYQVLQHILTKCWVPSHSSFLSFSSSVPVAAVRPWGHSWWTTTTPWLHHFSQHSSAHGWNERFPVCEDLNCFPSVYHHYTTCCTIKVFKNDKFLSWTTQCGCNRKNTCTIILKNN